MKNTAKIREIFESIQGEGLYVGEKQIFVRFSRCNLNCKFCDTDFSYEKSDEYDIEKLYFELLKRQTKVISFTGGEPLIEVDFLYDFLKTYKTKLNKNIYLETNGTLYSSLDKIIDFVDVVAMDIKLKSATSEENKFSLNEKFLDIANKKETFIKVVFDKNINEDEIKEVISLSKKHNNMIILQPKMPMDNDLNTQEIFNMVYDKYKNVRLIPQTHKFLNLL